jgi:tetratricopeptide (TPR) repeat protein
MDETKRPAAPEPTQAFTPPARPVPEPTQVIPPPATVADPLSDADKRKRIEAEMTKLGLSPDEVRRLLNANAHTADTSLSPLPKPTLIPPTAPRATMAKKGADRVTADSLAAFAAQLKAEKSAARQVSITTAGRSLPEFRESSVQEARAAEALLRDANMLRRREKFVEAEAKVREALELTPKDGSALELLGDILQGVARIDEALAAYRRATEADPRRSSAEKKYADLLTRQENWSNYDPEAAAPNVRFSVLLSLCLPGAGQFFYQSYIKGSVFVVLDVIVFYLLFFSPLGVADKHKHAGISVSLVALLAFTVVLYVAAIADTIAESKRTE